MLGRSHAITDKLPHYTQLEMTKIAHNWDHSKDCQGMVGERLGSPRGLMAE